MKIIIDTNTLIQSFNRRSYHHPIWQGIISGKYSLVVSQPILFEYEEVLERKFSLQTAMFIYQTLLEIPSLIYTDPAFHWDIITSDPDDNKFFDAAVAGNADYIVTNDKHFNAIKSLPFPPMRIISSDDFLQVVLSM